MKTLQTLLFVSLAVAGSHAARAQSPAQVWLETYYVNPRPAELTANLAALGREGFFEKPGHTALGIGFLAAVFERNPSRVESWHAEMSTLPSKTYRLVVAALWQSGHPLGAELLRQAGEQSSVREDVLRLAQTPAQLVVDTPVRSASSMNLQWGAFLATGDETHIVRIFDAFGQGERALDRTARLALAQNAAAHPRVLEICRAQLDRQPEEVRSVFRAALQDAGVPSPRI